MVTHVTLGKDRERSVTVSNGRERWLTLGHGKIVNVSGQNHNFYCTD
jgi:hypothetical protein